MSALGNILWLLFGGLVTALGYFIGGLLMCLTIIGIPFGLAAFGLGGAVLMPFGKTLSRHDSGGGCIATLLNIIWVVSVGWGIALSHLVFGVLLALTVIGLPFARQHFKLLPIALLPFTYRLE